MRCALALVVAGALLAAAGRSVNYCGAKMCGHTNAHTFCQYPPGPSPKCRGYMDAHLTAEEKVRIVARLNRRRSEAASGRLRHLPTAGNMLKLRWVEELAREAQRWADQCRPPRTPDERDACRDLYSTSVGQCVASVVGEAPGLRVESMVDLWYMQSMLYKGNVTYYVIPMSNISYYGDFAQMIWARSYMVGCGRSRFMSEWNGRMRSVERLVCNIAPRGPQPFGALWVPAVPTSVCPPRSVPDPELTAMCNFQRDLDASSDVDGAMTLEEHVLLSIVLEIENKEILNYLGSLDEMYMTKLAVVTMDSRVTTVSYYNPVHKRDIIETLGLDESIVHIDNVIVDNDINDFLNATRIILKIENTVPVPQKSVTKKANLIGRPKSYNIEDLNNVDGDHKFEEDMNNHDDIPRQDISKIDRDIYMDYAFLDTIEDNVSSVSESKGTINDHQLNNSSTMISESFAITTPLDGGAPDKITEKEDVNMTSDPIQVASSKTTTTINDYFANVTKKTNTSTEAVTLRSDEDYLTDPETVRQLQEALDRMEHSMEETRPAGKVRRELRTRNLQDMLPENKEEYVPKEEPERRYVRQETHHDTAVPDKNKTDRTPMLNMVLKYMPYLKPYQSEILGAASSAEYNTVLSCPILYLVLVLF